MKKKKDQTILNDNLEINVPETEVPVQFISEQDALYNPEILVDINESDGEEDDDDFINKREASPTVELNDIGSYSAKVKSSLVHVDKVEIRALVDSYYKAQRYRISTGNQVYAIESAKDSEGAEAYQCSSLRWVLASRTNEELQLKKMLETAVSNFRIGRWLDQIVGIGPVISACLIAFLDISKATSATHFWSYAGLNDNNAPWLGTEKAKDIVTDAIAEAYSEAVELNKANPTDERTAIIAKGVKKFPINDKVIEIVARESGRKFESILILATDPETKQYSRSALTKNLAKPPYNKRLKTLCWKIGESFSKQISRPASEYGKQLLIRKEYEKNLNESGAYRQEAMISLGWIDRRKKNFKATPDEISAEFEKMLQAIKNKTFTPAVKAETKAYAAAIQGKLSVGHINSRAKRWTVKLFISHLFEAMYIDAYQNLPPIPYVIMYGGHVDYIKPEVPYDSLWNTEVDDDSHDMDTHIKTLRTSGAFNVKFQPSSINRVGTSDMIDNGSKTEAPSSLEWIKKEAAKIKTILESSNITIDQAFDLVGYNPSQRYTIRYMVQDPKFNSAE